MEREFSCNNIQEYKSLDNKQCAFSYGGRSGPPWSIEAFNIADSLVKYASNTVVLYERRSLS